jgi:hypothetical protein
MGRTLRRSNVQYLGEKASRCVYFAFDRDPRELGVTAVSLNDTTD